METALLTVSQLNPGVFASVHLPANQGLGRFDALYLSFVSLTCKGCIDIKPLKVARMLVMMESTIGVLYVAVLIARLVALYSKAVESGREK